jgi:hypothetical protein
LSGLQTLGKGLGRTTFSTQRHNEFLLSGALPWVTAVHAVPGDHWPFLEAKRSSPADGVAARRLAAEQGEGVGAADLLARQAAIRWESTQTSPAA